MIMSATRIFVLITLFTSSTGCQLAAPLADQALPPQGTQDAMALSTPPAPVLDFLDLAHVHSAVTPCDDTGSTMWTEDKCYNEKLPPEPSITRSFVMARPDVDSDHMVPFTAEAPIDDGKTHTIGTRSSVDGRLNIVKYGNKPELAMFYPENLAQGWQTQTDLFTIPPDSSATIEPFMIYNDVTAVPKSELLDKNHYPHSAGTDLCNRGDESEPYRCEARLDSTESYVEGTCYDISILMTFPRSNTRELRSNRLTVYARNGHVVPVPGEDSSTGGPHEDLRETWIYPTAGVELLGLGWHGDKRRLPDFDQFAEATTQFDSNYSTTSTPGGRKLWHAAWEMARDCKTDYTPSTQPAWCMYFADQKWGSPDRPDADTRSGGSSFIEISSTADGKVLVGLDAEGYGIGTFYSYNQLDACDASGWQEARPISSAHIDSDVNKDYGFAHYPIEFADGSPVPPSYAMDGAYPWIDRKGANVFMGGHIAPFGWRECDTLSQASDGECVGSEVIDVNDANAKMPKVVGLWTRGRVLHLDGVLNQVDMTARPITFGPAPDYAPIPPLPFWLALFDDKPFRKMYPANNTDFFTYENLFNQHDQLAPITPADVVWTMKAGSNQALGEIAFDDYMTRGSLIIAPMNDRLKLVTSKHSPKLSNFKRENGMHQSSPADPFVPVGEKFTGTDIFLQNNATDAHTLPILQVRGGAFIPPVSTGVIGKAVYLDGLNDRIELTNVPDANAFYMGAWLDVPDDGLQRTLFTFSNEVRFNVSEDKMALVVPTGSPTNCGGPCTYSLPTSAPKLEGFHHFAVAMDEGPSIWAATDVRFYLDGEEVYSFRMHVDYLINDSHATTTFAVGATEDYGPDGTVYKPVKGWVDELKLFELEPTDFDSALLKEQACNRALGSLNSSNVCEQIPYDDARGNDPYGTGATDDQMTGLEFPLTAYEGHTCANSVHRNGPVTEDCGRPVALGLSDIDPDLVRPDTSANEFCLTCHDSTSVRGTSPTVEPHFDLSIFALTGGAVSAIDDRRRQPMQPPRAHDRDLWNGVRRVLHEDVARIDFTDTVDNDGNGGTDEGDGVCGADDELGRIAIRSSFPTALARTPDSPWNHWLTSPINNPGFSCLSRFPATTSVKNAYPTSCSGASCRGDDLKPFYDFASSVLEHHEGDSEYVCCGTAPPETISEVTVTADLDVFDDSDPSTELEVVCANGTTALVVEEGEQSVSCPSGDVTIECSTSVGYVNPGAQGTWVRSGSGPWLLAGSCNSTHTSCSTNWQTGEYDLHVLCFHHNP